MAFSKASVTKCAKREPFSGMQRPEHLNLNNP